MLIWNTATENDLPHNTSPGDKGVHSITHPMEHPLSNW